MNSITFDNHYANHAIRYDNQGQFLKMTNSTIIRIII